MIRLILESGTYFVLTYAEAVLSVMALGFYFVTIEIIVEIINENRRIKFQNSLPASKFNQLKWLEREFQEFNRGKRK